MNYFFFNGEWWHCDPKFEYKATDKDKEVWLFRERPYLKLERGLWDSDSDTGRDIYIGCETVDTIPWTESLVEL